ncbi:unnamed protein product [Victoria cruziana]
MHMERDEGDPSLALHRLRQDALSVLSSIRHEKKLQLMKKRWLMGVPKIFKLSKHTLNDLRRSLFSADRYILEPLLRNDNVFPEVAKEYLADCFSSFKKDQPMPKFVKEIVFPFGEDVVASQTRECAVVRRVLLPVLDDLNISSLCFLADVVTRKSVKFEKTRPCLESVIKKYLPIFFGKSSSSEDALGLKTQLMEVFKDPKNFRENSIPLVGEATTSCHSDINMILERLEDFSLHTLDAMRRKLWKRPCSLYAEPCRNRNKKQLISSLRRKIKKFFRGRLPENVGRALRVACLSVKLMNEQSSNTFPEVFEVPPEIETLQDEILKAIWSLPSLPPDEVKELHLLVDPDANIDMRFLRTKMKNLLIECLFQCDELMIPQSILKAISSINSYRGEMSTKEKIEDELICMLNMGSCMKQLVWDLSEHPNIDKEFWHAYKDESEMDDDSSNDDDSDDDMDDKENHCSNYEKVDILVGNESFKATHMEKQEDVSVMTRSSITSASPLLPENDGKSLCKVGAKNSRVTSGEKSLSEEDLHVFQEPYHFMPMDEPCLPKKLEYLFPTFSELAKSSLTDRDLSALQDVTGNEYLIIEGICDEVSLFSHKFIGYLIEKLLKVDSNHLDSASRSYLQGSTSVLEKHTGEMENSSCENMDSLAFIQAVNELVPSFPKSGMRRLLEVLKQS